MLAKGRHWPLVDQVLLNDGTGRFHATPLGPPDRTYEGLLVDIDADHDLDVVISNDEPDPKRVYLNDGRGHFTPGSTFGTPEWPTRNISVADLNGDALPDIIVANRTGNDRGFNYVFLNHGAGEFDSECLPVTRESTTINRDGRHFQPVAFGDNKGTAYGIAIGDATATVSWTSRWHDRKAPTSSISEPTVISRLAFLLATTAPPLRQADTDLV